MPPVLPSSRWGSPLCADSKQLILDLSPSHSLPFSGSQEAINYPCTHGPFEGWILPSALTAELRISIQAQMEDKGVGLIDQAAWAPVQGLAWNGSFRRCTGPLLASLPWLNQVTNTLLNRHTQTYTFRFILCPPKWSPWNTMASPSSVPPTCWLLTRHKAGYLLGGWGWVMYNSLQLSSFQSTFLEHLLGTRPHAWWTIRI